MKDYGKITKSGVYVIEMRRDRYGDSQIGKKMYNHTLTACPISPDKDIINQMIYRCIESGELFLKNQRRQPKRLRISGLEGIDFFFAEVE